MKRFQDVPRAEPRDEIETQFHNLTNALSAARSYADVLRLRAESEDRKRDVELADGFLRELDHADRIMRNMRRETHRPGDVLECTDCGYTFVYAKSSKTRGACKRCKSTRVERWRPDA